MKVEAEEEEEEIVPQVADEQPIPEQPVAVLGTKSYVDTSATYKPQMFTPYRPELQSSNMVAANTQGVPVAAAMNPQEAMGSEAVKIVLLGASGMG
eukprot:CAMPEP_0182478894 /NCGR_PEP_ID=MMETSP1319-20130603/33224_1 /TAXON_ID=172717 /ORGANISM="Bolidomonas pacifica, Strain RCC208" /LENGTH=95 /DNA_ID=CAMNT_0024680265 /DNA_START=33 /DNA_END=316 /DNA_ORIENTATION=+